MGAIKAAGKKVGGGFGRALGLAQSSGLIQSNTDKAQADELASLKSQEEKRTAAALKKKRGRASLISGSERGIDQGKQETLG